MSELAPIAPSPSPESIAAAGVRRFQRGDYAGAIEDFSRVLSARPRDAGALLWRASCYRALRRVGAAWKDIRAARRLAPSSAAIRVTSGALLGDRGLYREALKECATALRIDPKSAPALELSGDLHLAAGETTKASRAYREALGLAPGSAGVCLKSAIVLRDLGYTGLALQRCRQARRLDPKMERARTLEAELSKAPRPPAGGRTLRRGPYPALVIDARLELLWVVLTLAGRGGVSAQYARRTLRRFRPFRNHPAVGSLREALDSGLSLIGAQRSILSLGAPPSLRPVLSHSHIHRPQLLERLRNFAREADFSGFFRENKAFYSACRMSLLEQTRGRDYAAIMEEYSGLPITAHYSLDICPLMPLDGTGRLNFVGWDGRRGTYHIHSTIGPAGFKGKKPLFDYAQLRWSIWHELGHSLLDRLLEEHTELAESTERLFEGAASRYGHWPQTIREHVVQGLATRMLSWAAETGRTADPAMSPDLAHLPYLGAVVERLKEYERDRARYPTLHAFYPRLIEVFAGLKPRRRAGRTPTRKGVDAIL